MKMTENTNSERSAEFRAGYTQALRDLRKIVAKYRGREASRDVEDRLIVREIELQLGVFRVGDWANEPLAGRKPNTR